MKAIKDVVLEVKVFEEEYGYGWEIENTKDCGIAYIPCNKTSSTKEECLANLKEFMTLNNFKYKVVEERK